MGKLDRFQETLAGGVKSCALEAIVDRELARQNIGEQGHFMKMPSSLAARGDGDDRGGHHRCAGRIGDHLPKNCLVVSQDRRQQVLIFRGGRRHRRRLRQHRLASEGKGQKCRRCDGTQLEHTQTPTAKRGRPDFSGASDNTVNGPLTLRMIL